MFENISEDKKIESHCTTSHWRNKFFEKSEFSLIGSKNYWGEA